MNPATEAKVDKALKAMSRSSRRSRGGGGFSPAPVILGIGLVLGYQLVSRLAPMVWGSMLPGGWHQADQFRGWPGLIWRLAIECHRNFRDALIVLVGIGLVGLIMSLMSRMLRPIVWLMAVAVIGIDAGIIYVIMRTAIEATAAAAGVQGLVP